MVAMAMAMAAAVATAAWCKAGGGRGSIALMVVVEFLGFVSRVKGYYYVDTTRERLFWIFRAIHKVFWQNTL
jgi:hypothetical protein